LYGVRHGARKRSLGHASWSDAELAAVWKAASEIGGAYGAYVRFVLLCACRRDEARWMTRSEIVNGVWTIPASRYKTGVDCVLPLSKAAQSLLAGLPKIGNSDFCFTLNGRNPVSGLAKFKHYLDEASGVRGWQIHDLRRTSRSLLSRCGVSADIGEMCLGHTLPTIRATYDRHSYLQEKAHAFEALATLIESIINPQQNVVPLRGAY
jgi:integrase